MVAKPRETIFRERTGDTESAAEEDTNHGGQPWLGFNTEDSDYSNPHQALLLSVVEKALADARSPTARNTGSSVAERHERESAITFLTAEHGPWATWRRQLCHLSGLDPESLELLVERERHSWPDLDTYNDTDHSSLYSSRGRVLRADPEANRRASRESMARKRARQRAQA